MVKKNYNEMINQCDVDKATWLLDQWLAWYNWPKRSTHSNEGKANVVEHDKDSQGCKKECMEYRSYIDRDLDSTCTFVEALFNQAMSFV